MDELEICEVGLRGYCTGTGVLREDPAGLAGIAPGDTVVSCDACFAEMQKDT